jgi:hypothetical protein
MTVRQGETALSRYGRHSDHSDGFQQCWPGGVPGRRSPTVGANPGFSARRSYPRSMPLNSTYAVRGTIAGRARPLCVRGHRAWSTGRKTHGRGWWERLRRPSTITCALSTYMGHVTDAHLDAGPHLRCTGKGRKQRCTPLTKPTSRRLRQWITDRNAAPGDPLFPSRAGGHLSRDAVADLLDRHLPAARQACPSLEGKHSHHTPCVTRRGPPARRHRPGDHRALAWPLFRSTGIYMPSRNTSTGEDGTG